MGPSGAGKTTLMDWMAGREINRFRGRFTGEMLVNGRPRKGEFVEISGHTPSNPVFLGTLTVYETLQYAAALTIGDPIARRESLNQIIDDLRLRKCLQNPVGTPLRKGISDGEKKRLALGMQLLRNPSILFLDEPTSGLDTSSSRRIIKILRNLADRGFTIVITIHSPDSFIYKQFNRVLMLVSGKLQYFGDASKAVERYEKVTGRKIKMNQNPAEYLFECEYDKVVYNEGIDSEKGVTKHNPLEISESPEKSLCCAPYFCATADESQGVLVARAAKPMAICQIFSLISRQNKHNSRSLPKYYLRLFIYTVIGACIGSAWFDIKRTFTTIHDRLTLLMVIIVFYSFMQVASLASFIGEITIINREILDGIYPVWAHVLVSTLTGLIPNFLLALPCSYVMCKMINFGDEGMGFPLFLVNMFLLLLVAESFAEFLCTGIKNLLVALCIYAAFFCASFIAMGLLVPYSHLPWFWQPLNLISFHRYSIEVFCFNAFHGWKVECDLWPKYLCRIYKNGDDVLKAREMSHSSEEIIFDLW
eukprot:CAMPEP_0167743466 /NCGR_PEP_ID=MMETSP0110_2-20121227/2031_1 /TAXON_ID=629695 /ORGANISM="Gymnochlora sp., Strain CCMP2014" /LENGTH=533 /DNA_ID=CAMNT_0007627839 /DNA_START=167 /DNA_END=1765 /DNA_ORIENTATION=-